jgi:hypothetical protein
MQRAFRLAAMARQTGALRGALKITLRTLTSIDRIDVLSDALPLNGKRLQHLCFKPKSGWPSRATAGNA